MLLRTKLAWYLLGVPLAFGGGYAQQCWVHRRQVRPERYERRARVYYVAPPVPRYRSYGAPPPGLERRLEERGSLPPGLARRYGYWQYPREYYHRDWNDDGGGIRIGINIVSPRGAWRRERDDDGWAFGGWYRHRRDDRGDDE